MKKIIVLFLIIFQTLNLYSETIKHTVTKGETLFGLALKYNCSTKSIMSENNLKTTDLKIDQVLLITKTEPDQYKVQPGDTLSGIAYENDITLKHLLQVNRINEEYKLTIGEILTIPTDPEIKKEYIVSPGDTLSWISMTYNISVDDIKKINKYTDNNHTVGTVVKLTGLEEEVIKPEIKQASAINLTEPIIETETTDKNYIVESGDTLSAIAYKFQTTIDDIKKINKLTDSNILIGQKLYLPSYALERTEIDYNIYHEVIKGDTLSGIAYIYDISETVLREINSITGDKISIGQKIKLIPKDSRDHIVQNGETLWSIAQQYNISVDQLMQYNHLNSTVVPVGKKLTLYDYSVANHETVERSNINLVALKYDHNTTASQPYKNYSKDLLTNPLEKYKKAKDNWKEFSSLIENESKISDDLKGWTVILDPGHGGKDPGAIAAVTISGETKYIVEDEYAYDTAVRLYELLKRNGAEVYMTILSPDHIARNPESDDTTFINEKNEIYNSYALNKINNSTIWPVGGQWGLNQRVNITNNLLSVTENKKSIFLSLHADNDVDRGTGKLILYLDNGTFIDNSSKELANSLIKDMGANAIIEGMSLGVLRGNKADYKILIELRNMAHKSEALALMDHDKRQKDAQIIVDGLKKFIKK